MKRKLLKNALLAVPAAALMLGSAEAQTTVGLNFQSWYYDSGMTPQTVGYGSGYQTTGFPVTATAFGVAVNNWYNTDPLPAQSQVSATVPFGPGGALSAQVTAPNTWQSGIGELNQGWVPEAVAPGNDEVTWGYLDDGNATGQGPSVSVSGLAAMFPHGYVIQSIAAEANTATFDNVTIGDGTTSGDLVYSAYFQPSPASDSADNGGTVGLSAQSGVLTGDTATIAGDPKTAGSRSTLAGFIITDIPVVTRPPVGSTNNVGGSFVLSAAGSIGIPPLSYQWQLNGTNLPGATAMLYTNSAAAASDSGDYTVVVQNAYGATTSQVAHVSVLQGPSIAQDLPAAVTNFLTMNAALAPVVNGPQPFTYTWFKNGQDAAATGPALNLTNLQTTDAGSYQVVVKNSSGAVTSRVAVVTVIPSAPPSESFNYSPGDLAGQNGGTGWSNAWTQETGYNGDHAVIAPPTPWRGGVTELTSTGGGLELAANGSADYDDIRSMLGSIGGNGAGTVYLSFVAQVTNTTWGGIELAQDGTTELFLGSCWEGANWGWGTRAAPEVASTISPKVYSLLIYRFDFSATNTAIRLYVNPATLSSEPGSATISGSEPKPFTFDQLRLVTHGFLGSGAGPDGVMDEIRIGGSWASVTPHTLRHDAPFTLSLTNGGVIADTKPDGTPHPGFGRNVSWLPSSTDVNQLTRTGVEQFSAANASQITAPADPDFNTTQGTICFWMQYSIPNAGFPGVGRNEAAMLFDRRTTNGTIIAININGSIEFQASGGANTFTGNSYVVDGAWHHVAITYDQASNAVVTLYVDGVQDTSQANARAWGWVASQEIELGQSHDPYWYLYDGQMDDFRIYKTILSGAEIAAIASPATSDQLEEPANLVLRYNFDTAGTGESLVFPFGTVQSSPTLGPGAVWTTLTNAVSPMPFLPTGPALFYRLVATP